MSLWFLDLNAHGNFILRAGFPQGVLDRHSMVLANICELRTDFEVPQDTPFIGDAGMEIRNIAPTDENVVELDIEIDWPSDLFCRIQFAVF